MEFGDGIGLWNWAVEYHSAYSATVSHGYTIAQPERLFCGPIGVAYMSDHLTLHIWREYGNREIGDETVNE
jgi:hypothetical protein